MKISKKKYDNLCKGLLDLQSQLNDRPTDTMMDEQRKLFQEVTRECNRQAALATKLTNEKSQLKRILHDTLIENARLRGQLERVRHEDMVAAELVEIPRQPSQFSGDGNTQAPRLVPKFQINSMLDGGSGVDQYFHEKSTSYHAATEARTHWFDL